MSNQLFLSDEDIEKLAELLLVSDKLKARELLCKKLGIDHHQLQFLRETSDADFVTQLIYYLNGIKDREALCKLCCRVLIPIFKDSTDSSLLKEISIKLKCEQADVIKKPIVHRTQKNLIVCAISVIALTALTGLTFLGYNSITNHLLIKDVKKALQQKEWKLANQKTTEKLLKEAGRSDLVGRERDQIKLNDKEIKKISCPVLQELNQLWESNSQGRFGFGKQYSIWKSVNPNWNKFAARVGWKKDGSEENNWTSLSFTTTANEGHLPSFIYVPNGQIDWGQFFNRIQYCNL